MTPAAGRLSVYVPIVCRQCLRQRVDSRPLVYHIEGGNTAQTLTRKEEKFCKLPWARLKCRFGRYIPVSRGNTLPKFEYSTTIPAKLVEILIIIWASMLNKQRWYVVEITLWSIHASFLKNISIQKLTWRSNSESIWTIDSNCFRLLHIIYHGSWKMESKVPFLSMSN